MVICMLKFCLLIVVLGINFVLFVSNLFCYNCIYFDISDIVISYSLSFRLNFFLRVFLGIICIMFFVFVFFLVFFVMFCICMLFLCLLFFVYKSGMLCIFDISRRVRFCITFYFRARFVVIVVCICIIDCSVILCSVFLFCFVLCVVL